MGFVAKSTFVKSYFLFIFYLKFHAKLSHSSRDMLDIFLIIFAVDYFAAQILSLLIFLLKLKARSSFHGGISVVFQAQFDSDDNFKNTSKDWHIWDG